jgi:hypothetical protein
VFEELTAVTVKLNADPIAAVAGALTEKCVAGFGVPWPRHGNRTRVVIPRGNGIVRLEAEAVSVVICGG